MERYYLLEHGGSGMRRQEPILSALRRLGNSYEAAYLMAAEERLMGWRATVDLDHLMSEPAGAPGRIARGIGALRRSVGTSMIRIGQRLEQSHTASTGTDAVPIDSTASANR